MYLNILILLFINVKKLVGIILTYYALFDKARQHHQEQLALAKKLDGDTGIEEQANAQFWLGRCYFEQALQTGNAALFDDARRYFQEWLECTKKLSGDKGVEEQANAQFWLGRCYLKQTKQKIGRAHV